MKDRLYRSDDNCVIGGVCGGLGEYFDIDPVFIRLGFVALTCFGIGIGAALYVIGWIVIPER